MSSDSIISVNNLSKQYKLYNKPSERLWESCGLLFRPVKTFYALQDVSFKIQRGESFGIIGQNGAGKSTLLQLICQTLQPTSGQIHKNGRIAALLELGAGFNTEFTGKENIYTNAAIMGLSRAEIDNRLQEIIDFSELSEFIDNPVKTYSSGMFVRLAFSIATMIEPDILVIDEALSVGDGAFAKKSFDKIMSLKEKGVTIIFCSHSLYQIEALCDRAIWLNHGRVGAIGDTQSVIIAYQEHLASLNRHQTQQHQGNNARLYIESVQLTGGTIIETIPQFQSEEDDLSIHVRCHNPESTPIVLAIVIHQINDECVCSFSSHIDHFPITNNKTNTLCIPKLPLLKGQYYIDLFLMCDQGIHVYEHVTRAATFKVTQSHLEVGVVHLPRTWQLTQ